MVLFFGDYESLSKGYNVLNEFMFQSHMRFCRMQWLPTRFYGSLSVYSRPLPSEKIAPLQPSYAFRRFLFMLKPALQDGRTREEGGTRGRRKVWDRETMFSQLAKRSPSVVVSG